MTARVRTPLFWKSWFSVLKILRTGKLLSLYTIPELFRSSGVKKKDFRRRNKATARAELNRSNNNRRIGSLALVLLFFAGSSGKVTAEPRNETLDKIVVSATKTPHTLGDVPVAAEVITREELLEKNVRTVQEALEKTTGLTIEANSGSYGDKGHVSIHGLEFRHTLVLIDGQRILGGHQNAIDIQQISIEMI